jgi:UDP-N-acetylmuramyl pentapeptide phosphotransferase/UDP-N-acetylglucosamine-1-phosphate transferase
VAAATTAAVLRALDSRTGRGGRRQNYRGGTVTLSAGPAVVVGLLAGMAAGAGRRTCAAALAVAGAGAAGFYDDRASAREEERLVKGFAGHLRALARGSASAGVVKLAVIGSSSLAAAAVRSDRRSDRLLDGCLVAGAANLCNLLDLRPGRALKVAAAAGALAAPTAAAPERVLLAAFCGALAVALPADLGERSMLGDTGANAVGALVGSVLCGRSRRTRAVALGVVAGLTALSERVSFSAVIEANPVLRRLDELGRTVD